MQVLPPSLDKGFLPDDSLQPLGYLVILISTDEAHRRFCDPESPLRALRCGVNLLLPSVSLLCFLITGHAMKALTGESGCTKTGFTIGFMTFLFSSSELVLEFVAIRALDILGDSLRTRLTPNFLISSWMDVIFI